MRVLCAVGLRGGPEIIRRLAGIIGPGHELVLLHVIDSGPRQELEGFLRRPGLGHRPLPLKETGQKITAAEMEAGQRTLSEAADAAQAAGYTPRTDLQRGKAEQVIVRVAREQDCALIVLHHQEGSQGRPQIGPESVGHTARFVLDHAPCDVLLLREPAER